MQVFGLPSHCIRNGRAASRLLGAKTPNIEAERRRDAVARWRRAMADGLASDRAARAVGEARANLYRWEKRLEPRSRRPARLRKPVRPPGLVEAIERLRLDFPMWGRAKLGPLVRKQGFAVSDATVGRIIAQLVARGAVQPVPTLRRRPYARRWTAKRRFAQRLPRDLTANEPGSLVQLDTVHVNVAPDKSIKHFTAYDPIAKWTVAKAFNRATAASAAIFLDKIVAEMPFPVKAIQVDGGSEFMAEFEDACEKKGPQALRPPAQVAANERRGRAVQWRLAIRILRRLRPAEIRGGDQSNPRQLPAPLQPSKTTRSPWRKNPIPLPCTTNSQ